jgi:drug/metabolite transporter (DMT)-like permease
VDGGARKGLLFGLAAAVSFGASAPLAKSLLPEVRPQMLAALLYLGAFWALTLVPRSHRAEARLRRTDVPRMAAMIVAGGMFAPVLLLLGLERVSGVSGSLLLNLEGPFTILLGVTLFREHLSRQAVLGSVVIFSGGLVLGAGAGGIEADWLGVLLIAGACAAWSLDNNLTQSLTVRDPRSIVQIKAGFAGLVNLGIAVALGQGAPPGDVLVGALALGGVSYGLSVYWDALALRALGAAREAAIFAVAPFAGALLAPLILPESFGVQEIAAGLLMACGVVLLIADRHTHRHRHEPMMHDHVHVHDEHHRHGHDAPVDPRERHSHPHVHDVLVHEHEHVSDVHHRHDHD